MQKKCHGWILAVCLLASTLAHAIDNPDAPDHVNAFLQRTQTHEQGIAQTPHTTQSYGEAYAAYEAFLDRELNAAYTQLLSRLSAESGKALKQAQRQWLNYRDQEFDWIARNWTQENFGSSATISRGDFRTRIIKDRVEILLQYLRNY